MDFPLLAGPIGLEPQTLVLIALAGLLAGLARGFSGFGAALIFMPLAGAFTEPKIAAPLLLIIDTFSSVGMIPDAWRRADRPSVFAMTAGALVGIPAGVVLLKLSDPLVTRWLIAATAFGFLALLVSGWRYRGTPSNLSAGATGMLSGLFSGAAGIGGPPVIAFWLGGALPLIAARASIILFFAFSTVFSAVSYALAGMFVAQLWVLALASGPAYLLGVVCGSRAFGLASESFFRRACYGLIGLAAAISLPVLDPLLR